VNAGAVNPKRTRGRVGRDVQFLKISAKTGEGIDELIEALIVQTEILELKAPVEGPASGIVIESRLDKGRGVVATVLIQKGTLESGQMVLCGMNMAGFEPCLTRTAKLLKTQVLVRRLRFWGFRVHRMPVMNFWWCKRTYCQRLAKHREDRKKLSRHAVQQASKLEEVFSRMATGELACVNLVLKTDVQGSLKRCAAP